MKKITIEEVIQIFKEDSGKWEGDNCYKGLQIIARYSDFLIEGADHDIVYSKDIEELIEAGMTRKEFKQLREINWHIEDGTYLACFV